MPATRLLAAVGDIHGRFERVDGWLRELAQRHGRPVEACFAVGDLETFDLPDAPLRKRTKRLGAAEFGPYGRGEKRLPCPLYFIGGNNEDFVALHPVPGGAAFGPDITYLGRAGMRELAGLEVAYLSGIFAPKSIDAPLPLPTNLELARRAGHFRSAEVAQVMTARQAALVLLHDWPKGLAGRTAGLPAGAKPPPPFWGNAQARLLLETVRPPWALCGHQHRAFAGTLGRGPSATRVACLDEAELPGTALLWLEVDGSSIVRVGWGLSTTPAWETGRPWDASCVPGSVAAETSKPD
jgi:lariat debranching enzyme